MSEREIEGKAIVLARKIIATALTLRSGHQAWCPRITHGSHAHLTAKVSAPLATEKPLPSGIKP